MAFRTEISLEELLADPMVKLVMCRDGVSMSEALSLYASVRPWLKDGAIALRRRPTTSPGPVPWTESPGQISPCI
jgi:hypothetical protein